MPRWVSFNEFINHCRFSNCEVYGLFHLRGVKFRENLWFWGQFALSSLRNSGPSSHTRRASEFEGFSPRDTMSAGFRAVSTYLHWAGCEVSWISDSRLAMYVLNRLLSFLMYWSTEVESVQRVVLSIFISSSCSRSVFSLVATTAAESSRRGIVMGLRGASRDLPMTNEQCTCRTEFISLKYATDPYPVSDASANMWSSIVVTLPNSTGMKHLLMEIFEIISRSRSHSFHSALISSSMGSSHPTCCLQSSCSSFLAVSVTGATKPRGSHNELMTDSSPRLVAGFFLNAELNWKQSFSTFHDMPSVRSMGSSSRSRLTTANSLDPWPVSLLLHSYQQRPDSRQRRSCDRQ